MTYLSTKEVEKIEKYPATLYYVTKSGSDSNDGKSVETAFLTINYAISQVSETDRIIIGAGTYDENVVLNVKGVSLKFELGNIIAPSSGIGLVVSGGYNYINGNLVVTANAGLAGVHVTTNGNNRFKNTQVSGGATGFDVDTPNNEFNNCRSGSPSAFGFDIDGGQCKLLNCNTIGSGGVSVGYSIGAVSNGILINCTSANHTGGGYVCLTGSSNWTILGCSSGGGDGKWLDIDDANVWSNFSYADRLYKLITLTSTGGDEYGTGPTAADGTHYNLFKVIGAVKVHAISGHVVTQCAATSSIINLELSSNGGTTDITSTGGAPNLNAAPVGTLFIRNSLLEDPLDSANPSTQPQVIENDNFRNPELPLPMLADTGADSFITLVLSTPLASGEIHWHCHWEPITDEGFVTAV